MRTNSNKTAFIKIKHPEEPAKQHFVYKVILRRRKRNPFTSGDSDFLRQAQKACFRNRSLEGPLCVHTYKGSDKKTMSNGLLDNFNTIRGLHLYLQPVEPVICSVWQDQLFSQDQTFIVITKQQTGLFPANLLFNAGYDL